MIYLTNLRLTWIKCWECRKWGLQKRMDYFLNEYSLRGQFKNTDDFFLSLRDYTLPVLLKIQENKENVIWKKDTFWQCQVCENISISDVPKIQKQGNERSSELTALKMKLIRLTHEEPFWESEGEGQIKVKEYGFDTEFRDNFEEVNCFYKAIQSEGRIVSFLHEAYHNSKLPVLVNKVQAEIEIFIDNVYTPDWWEQEPKIKTWRVNQRYLIEIRANEFSYHPPHFHVTSNEYSAVFKLSDGALYKEGKNKWPPDMIREIWKWYGIHKEELTEAWENLHGN